MMLTSVRAATSKMLAVVLTGLVGLAALGAITAARQGEGTPVAGNAVILHPSYPYDYSDDRVLVGAAQFVFLGEVIEQVGTKGVPTSDPETEIPQTQFRVKVITEVKGDLPDEIVVSQSSGVEKSTGILVLIDGDPVLQSSETILFAVNEDKELGWYTIMAGPFGTTRANDAHDAASLVARFEQAALQQFVPVPDPNFVPPSDPAVAPDKDGHDRKQGKDDGHGKQKKGNKD